MQVRHHLRNFSKLIFMHNKVTFSPLKVTFSFLKTTFSSLKVTFTDEFSRKSEAKGHLLRKKADLPIAKGHLFMAKGRL